MNPNPSIEQTLSDAAAATPLAPVSRDEVRGWVVEVQSHTRKRTQRIAFTALLGFLLLVAGIGYSMNHQVQRIRQLIEKNPSRAVTEVEEITLEICQAPPANYFIQQLSNRKPIRRSIAIAAR